MVASPVFFSFQRLLMCGWSMPWIHVPIMIAEVTLVEDPIPSSSEGVLFESVITLSEIGKLNKRMNDL